MAVFLYSRVSLTEQSVENQKLAAKSAGFTVDYFYSDEGISGSSKADTREQWSLMLAKITKGDVLVVAEISRIGRNTIDVLTTIKMFQTMGVKVTVLAYGSLDLTSEMGQLVVTMSAAFAQLELSDLKRRTRAGMARTKASGTKLGQPLKITPDTLEAIIADKKEGMTLDMLAAKHSVARSAMHANILKWGDNLEGYREEFNARQAQYALSKAA